MKNFNKSADRSLFLRGSRLKMNLKVFLNKIIGIRHKLTTTIVPRSKILSMTMETMGSISMKPRSNRKRWHNAEGDTHSCAVLHRLFFSFFFSLGKNVGQSRAVNDPDRFRPELFTRVSYRIEETAVTRTDRSTISR